MDLIPYGSVVLTRVSRFMDSLDSSVIFAAIISLTLMVAMVLIWFLRVPTDGGRRSLRLQILLVMLSILSLGVLVALWLQVVLIRPIREALLSPSPFGPELIVALEATGALTIIIWLVVFVLAAGAVAIASLFVRLAWVNLTRLQEVPGLKFNFIRARIGSASSKYLGEFEAKSTDSSTRKRSS